MAEKLRSILKRTNWSSLLKAVVFALAWWASPFLSFWVFLAIALYLYFIPITGAGRVSAPFLVLLWISFIQQESIFMAVIFGAIFYFILLIKDLIIIDRRTAYEVLMLVLSYLLVRSFFLNVGGSLSWLALVYGLVAAWGMSALVSGFVRNFSAEAGAATREGRMFRRMLGWMSFFLLWQLLIVGLFLPLDFLYQSAITFLVAAIILDLIPQYLLEELSRTKVLVTSTILFTLLVIIATSARWVI